MDADPRYRAMAPADFFGRHCSILEQFLGVEWFRKQRKHPAYKRWELCKTVSQQDGILRYPEQKDALPLINRIVLDSSVLAELTGGNVPELVLGSTEIPEALRRRLLRAEDFENFMVELGAAGALARPGREVHLEQRHGWPDLQLSVVGVGSILVECKHLTSGTENAVRRVLRKASNQVKAASRSLACQPYGVAWLDVTAAAGVTNVPNTDEVPQAVQVLRDYVERAIGGADNTHIALVLVVWDAYVQLGQPPQGTLTVLSRHVIQAPHRPGPNVKLLPEGLRLFEGFTVGVHVNWSPRTTG